MVAFRIKINGKPFREAEAVNTLTMVAEEIPERKGQRISLHASAGDGPLQWLAANLAVGDEIVIQVVVSEAQDASFPKECNFCGKDYHDVSHLMQGHIAAICGSCISDLGAALTTETQLPLGTTIRSEPTWVCGFCGNQPDAIPGVLVCNDAAICPACLRACEDILSEGLSKK